MKKATYLMALLVLSTFFTNAQPATGGGLINISKLIAYEKDNRFYIDWATDGNNATNYWEVQSSVDGKNFSTIAIVLGADPGKTGDEYGYRGKIDSKNPSVYYRVVHISTAGAKQQSDVIKLIKLESMSFINPTIKSKVPVLL